MSGVGLADVGAAEQIVDALGDISSSVVVEIGPGKGALTQVLARRAHRLIAVELDRMMSTELRFKYRLQPQVEIIEADVLKLDFRTVLNRTIGPLNDLRPLKPSPRVWWEICRTTLRRIFCCVCLNFMSSLT